jgi:hypothetical protein
MSKDDNLPTITAMREHLMATLASLRDRENPMEVDRARAVAQVAGVLVESAKVEVEYIRVTGGEQSKFLESVKDDGDILPRGITGITRHRLQG